MELGIKIGSQNTAVARRKEDGTIELNHTKTCVRYPKGALKMDEKPIIGDKAMVYEDVISPMRFGVVENIEGITHLVDILKTLGLPEGINMILASPGVQMKNGNAWLAEAIKQACAPKSLKAFSEGACSAAWLGGAEFINKSAIFSLNAGSTTFEVGCFRELNEIFLSAHPEISGNRVDKVIINRIRNTVGDAVFSENAIREMKEHASLLHPKTFTVEGITRKGKVEVQVCDEVTTSLKEYAEAVASIFSHEAMQVIEANTRNMALKSPLFMSGGMLNIEGMPELINDLIFEKTHHKFEISYSKEGDSHHIAAKGALLIAEEIAKEDGDVI